MALKTGHPALTSETIDVVESCHAAACFLGSYRDEHSAIRTFMRIALGGNKQAALYFLNATEDEDAVDRCEAIDLDALQPARTSTFVLHIAEGISAEVGSIYDDPRCFFTPADLISLRGGHPHVARFYRGTVAGCNPSSDSQLLGAALGIRDCWTNPWLGGPTERIRCGEYHLSCIGVMDDGSLEENTTTVDDEDLDDYLHRIRHVQARVLPIRQAAHERNEPVFHPSHLCAQCPLNRACPAREGTHAPLSEAPT